jgi:hypothetical protein
MAELPTAAVDPKIAEEAKNVLGDARADKAGFLTDFTEAFQFCFPQRVTPGTSATSGSRSNSASSNFTSIGEMVIADFASAISYTFAPEHAPWAGLKLTTAIPDELKDQAQAAIDQHQEIIFEAIGASSFHEAFKQGAKDLGVSAFGMIIQDPGRAEPIKCQVIPLNELLIWRGPDGDIAGRFWEQTVKVRHLKDLFPGITLPRKIQDKKNRNKNSTCKKTQGCWRDYSKPGVMAWHTITMLDDEPIQYSHSEGFGSCSILVCRWDADSPFAWGNGPAIKALPDLRALDEATYLLLKGMARAVDPPVAYDDDSILNMEGGISNGALFPRMPGSKIDVIETQNPNSMAEVVKFCDGLAHVIRRHFYVDQPEQEGLTPPTLGQWMDESLRTQRRLGTPAAAIWTEFLSEAFMRFRYLLLKRGDLKPIAVDGKLVTLRPDNPLQRAAEMEEAGASLRTLQQLEVTFPGMLPFFLDVGPTIHKIVQQARATGLKLKDADEIDQALASQQQMSTLGAAATAVGQSGLPTLLASQQRRAA